MVRGDCAADLVALAPFRTIHSTCSIAPELHKCARNPFLDSGFGDGNRFRRRFPILGTPEGRGTIRPPVERSGTGGSRSGKPPSFPSQVHSLCLLSPAPKAPGRERGQGKGSEEGLRFLSNTRVHTRAFTMPPLRGSSQRANPNREALSGGPVHRPAACATCAGLSNGLVQSTSYFVLRTSYCLQRPFPSTEHGARSTEHPLQRPSPRTTDYALRTTDYLIPFSLH